MRWSELDLVAGTWTLPAERSKNHRSHTIGLPPTVLKILRAIPHTGRNAFNARETLFLPRQSPAARLRAYSLYTAFLAPAPLKPIRSVQIPRNYQIDHTLIPKLILSWTAPRSAI